MRRLRWAGTTAVVCTFVLLVPQVAYASTPLADATVVTTPVVADYTFSSTTDYWSVVAVSTTADYDLRLYDGASTLLDSSAYGTGDTDFVAINSNLRALGAYRASVIHYSGTEPYSVEQRQGHTVTTLPIPANNGVDGASDPDLAFAFVNSQDIIGITDVYLQAGDKFWVNTPNADDGFYFLESNPGNSATFLRSRSQAATIAGTHTSQGCTLYTTNLTGWHAFVVLNINPPVKTDPGSGIAYAIHRYDPARPNTCPQRNFPAPTPPGP